MYREVLRDARFFELLLRIDREESERVRHARCPYCGGPLHDGHFARKARGILLGRAELPEGFDVRFDWCCGKCRRRTLPESVRFLGRKVYLAVVVAVATVVEGGSDGDARRLLRRQLGVSSNTLARWRRWWRELTGSAFWQSIRGMLPTGLDLECLPAALLESFQGEAVERVRHLLELLRPLTGSVPVTLGEGPGLGSGYAQRMATATLGEKRYEVGRGAVLTT